MDVQRLVQPVVFPANQEASYVESTSKPSEKPESPSCLYFNVESRNQLWYRRWKPAVFLGLRLSSDFRIASFRVEQSHSVGLYFESDSPIGNGVDLESVWCSVGNVNERAAWSALRSPKSRVPIPGKYNVHRMFMVQPVVARTYQGHSGTSYVCIDGYLRPSKPQCP